MPLPDQLGIILVHLQVNCCYCNLAEDMLLKSLMYAIALQGP